MKGLSGLWRNECFKIYRQTANRVIIIIALSMSLVIPVFNLLISGAVDVFDSGYNNLDYWRENAEVDLENENYISYSDWMARIEATTFFEDNGVSQGTWKYHAFYENYRSLLLHRYCFNYYLEGKISEKETAEYLYWDYFYSSDNGSPVGEKEYVSDGEDVEEKELEWFETLDVEDEVKKIGTQISDIETTLKNLTVKDYANMQLISAHADLTEKKTALGEIKAQQKKGAATDNDVLQAQLDIEAAEYIVSFYEHMAKTTVPEKDSDWLVSAASIIGSSAGSALANVPVSEEEFHNNAMASLQYGTDDYDDYCKSVERNRTNARRALMTADYAIENGIALPEMTAHSAKTLARSSFTTVSQIIVIALIIVTSNNIALEYSSGTIRLLLIRPRKRSKIILSKFFALFTVGIIVSIASYVIIILTSTLLNGAIYGTWDTFTPDLLCFSKVIKINSLLYSLAKLFLPLISGLVLLSLAFMMAIVTRRAALAIIAPVILSYMSSILQLLAVNFVGDFPILKYTILPYFDLGQYLVSPVSNYSLSDLNIMAIMSGNFGVLTSGPDISALTGTVVVLLHAVLFYFLGFLSFNKQQIKN